MSFTTVQEKDKAFTNFFSELESISISSSDIFSKNVTKYLVLNNTFSIQQNLIILKHFESKCSVEVFIYRQNKHSINAKFKFVKVILSILYIIQKTKYGKFFNKNFMKLENILNVLMLFSVIRSLQQLNLFKLNYDDDYKILNNEMFKDEINLIELMNEFRSSIFNLARKFRRLFRKNLLSKITENNLIYEYMTWLMSIWIDTTLEIKNKLNLLEESQFVNSLRINSKECKIMLRLELIYNENNISKTIISRIPFFLDSIVYYICDFVLLMENLNSSFVDYLIPLLRKIVEFQSKRLKVSKSLYLRLILVYRKCACLNENELIFFEKLIQKMYLSKKFKNFCHNLIKKFLDQDYLPAFQLTLKLKTNEDCRDFFAYNLNIIEVNKLYEALRNRSFRKSAQIINLINQEIGKIRLNSSHLITEKLNSNSQKSPAPCNSQENSKTEDENSYNNENELNFTSDISLFSSNTDSDDEQENCKFSEEQKNDLNESFMSLKKNVSGPTRNDLSCERNVFFSTSSPIDRNVSDFRSKFDLNMKSKERSPSPSNISRLNLFKNIFDNKTQSYNFNSNGNKCTESKRNEENRDKNLNFEPNFQNRFYKLNDLVSVMINEDIFQTW